MVLLKELPAPTADDIEIRVCKDQASYDEDIAIEEIDIYVATVTNLYSARD